MKNIFKMVKKDLVVEKLNRLSNDNFERFSKLCHSSNLGNYNDFKLLLQNYDMDINNIYFVEDHIYSTWYIVEPAYINLNNLFSVEILKDANNYIEKLNTLMKNGDWEALFLYMNDCFRVDFFIKNYKKIPKDKVQQILVELYTSREYILETLDVDIIEEILHGYNVEEIETENDFIEIYRGQTYASTDMANALSWTLSEETAEWFANRFNSNGIIYKAKVKIKDILMYNNDRSEEEVLVKYENIYDLTEI